MTLKRLLFLAFFLIFSSPFFAQFKITQLSSNFDELQDSSFLGITNSRSVKNLNSNWNVFFAEEPENISQISFPVTFTSEREIIFEKQFEISALELAKNYVQLNFLGINYTAEIFINNAGIYKHPGGEIPFTLDLPESILNYDTPNTLRIKILYNIDSKSTIPLLQRFHFPKSVGGILRDVFLHFRPKSGIKEIRYNLLDDKRPYEGRFDFDIHLEDLTKAVSDSLLENYDGRFKIEALLTKTTDTSRVYYNIWNINPIGKNDYKMDFYIRLRKVLKWSNESPASYVISVKLTNGDGYVYDEQRKTITLFDLEKKSKELLLNDTPIQIKGVTYIKTLEEKLDYNQIENDIKTISEAGFNTVRFSTAFPHPYSVYLCNKYGLFAFIELPLNSVPERFTKDPNFEERARSFLDRSIKYYDNFPNVLAYGTGGSYLSNSEIHQRFVSKLNSFIKETSSKFTYSSFCGIPENPNVNTDFYGIELFASDPSDLAEKFNISSSDSLIYIISEATYPTFKGATNGYLNNFSFEGQAKFFDDIITLTNDSKINGFVFNSMFDFTGDFAPMFSGFNEQNKYNIGIITDDASESRISYNLIKSRLNSESSIAIPIGNNEEDAPLFFIISALIISVIIALLINSKRKFREDATRALLRPYNFYADVRDQRILSGFHSNILMFLLAGSNALLVTILLFFLKNNILLDKFLTSFGSYDFKALIAYFAWNPEEAFIYIYIVTIIVFVLVSFLVHLSSFFVKTKVLYSSVYSVLIWAALPLALLVPIEAVLYKLLLLQTYNQIIYLILIFFLVWNIQRFLKGIYVIFDVRSIPVYAYAILTIIALLVSVGVYFQYTVSAFDYIYLAIKQYIIL